MFNQLLAALRYGIRAQTKYYLHSPFVYALAENVIYDPRSYYAFYDIADLRRALLKNSTMLIVTDLGASTNAASKNDVAAASTYMRSIKTIANRAGATEKVGELLFKLANYFEANTCLELGTSLGLGSLYLAKARKKATIHTIEGCAKTAAIARQNFAQMRANNIKSYIGNIDAVLPQLLPQLPQLDLVWADGNHRYAPTLRYFEACLPHAHNDTVFVFDDIHWSKEMEQAWAAIQQHPQVTLTIDLFRLGLVFLRQEQQAKEHFTMWW